MLLARTDSWSDIIAAGLIQLYYQSIREQVLSGNASSNKHTKFGDAARCDKLATTLLLLGPNPDKLLGATSDKCEITFGDVKVD
jgi:hypothetical protein